MGRATTTLLVVTILAWLTALSTGVRSGTEIAGAASRGQQIETPNAAGSPFEREIERVAPEAKAMVLPTHTYVTAGETCTLQVWVGDSEDSLSCIECWLSFDTSLVDLILAEEGELFESAPFQRLFFWRHIAPDTESVEGCLLHYTAYTLLPGEIARYVFEAKANGVCPVRITRLNLFDKARVMYQPIVDPNAWIIIGNSTGVGTEPVDLDTGELRAVPNPFNPSTTLVLRVSDVDAGRPAWAVVSIFSPAGRRIRVVFEGEVPPGPGERRFTWDGKDEHGGEVASGVYFAVAKLHERTYTAKLVLVQ